MIANWAGNVRFQPRRLHRPRSMDELRQALDGHDRVRAVGSAHSFNRVADTEGVLIDLAEMPRGLDVDSAGRRARVSGGWTYGELCPRLHAAGWALENLASLPHISVPGACATATHGSGRRLGCLAAQIDEVELLTADAELVTVASDDDRFPAAAVSLGALGVVTGLTLRLRPAFSMVQHVHERVPLDAIAADLEASMTRAYSVCLFTAWEDRPYADAWVKRVVEDGAADTALGALIRPVLLLTEIRAVAADRLWLSPFHGRDSLAIHFSWVNDWQAVRAVLPRVEEALAHYGARPHWGKLFTCSREYLERVYGASMQRFRDASGALDPRGRFRNDFLDRRVFDT